MPTWITYISSFQSHWNLDSINIIIPFDLLNNTKMFSCDYQQPINMLLYLYVIPYKHFIFVILIHKLLIFNDCVHIGIIFIKLKGTEINI